jgi:tRNA threonylcarbamoyladenosine biosynthesis protein TsaB
MIILALRTDKPEAELYLLDGQKRLAEIKWQAHLKLAETLNGKIEEILNQSSICYEDLDGIAVYKGPGSFTGLRIGISVANALAYAGSLPIAARGNGTWLEDAVGALAKGHGDKAATPEYGAPARITQPRR